MRERDLTEVSTGQILSEAFAAWRHNLLWISWAFLMPFIVGIAWGYFVPIVPLQKGQTISDLFAAQTMPPALLGILGVCYLAFSVLVYYGQFICCLRAVRGEPLSVGTVFSGGVVDTLRFFGALMIMAVLMMLGFILLIVPGFIVILTLFLFPFVMMDRRDLDLIEVLGETRRLMKGFKLDLFGIMIIFAIPAIIVQLLVAFMVNPENVVQLQVVTIGAGLMMTIFVAPWAMISYARFYEELISRDLPEKPRWKEMIEEKERKAADGAAADEDITPVPEPPKMSDGNSGPAA